MAAVIDPPSRAFMGDRSAVTIQVLAIREIKKLYGLVLVRVWTHVCQVEQKLHDFINLGPEI
jgi:hypothetical protein